MQRRAAAIYAAFFLVVAAGSYAVIGVAEQPVVTVEDPEQSLAAGDTLEVGDRTYTVGEVSSATNEGEDLRSGNLNWVNESAEYTASLEHNSTVQPVAINWTGQTTPGNEEYRLVVENATDPTSFTLTQEFNVSARLAADDAVEDETVTRADGREYVVYVDDGSTEPLDAYLPDPEQRSFAEGDPVAYQGNQTTVADVGNESVTLSWTGPRENSLSLSEGDVTTLGGTEYVTHFPDNATLELSTDVGAYEDEAAAVDTYHERIQGFWGITIVSGFASLLLLGMAYLPSRY